jgi:glycosyltransferase involved in cell wall biosynthesis
MRARQTAQSAEGGSGFLVDAGDHNAMAGRLLTILGDPRLANGMSENARALVQAKFTTATMVSRVVACYDALLDGERVRY